MRTNCPNCGAVMDGELYKCPYCGTQYIDFATIQADGSPTVLRIKTKEGAIMMFNTILTDAEMNTESEYLTARGGLLDRPICQFVVNNHSTIDLKFDIISLPQ